MKNFDELMHERAWRPIRNCPGRYTLVDTGIGEPGSLSVDELVGADARTQEFRSDRARDLVLVARIAGGGIIAYRRPDGSCLLTLNTEEGLRRKLEQLGISLMDE